MAKEFEDKFFNELRDGVIDNRTKLEKKRDDVKQAIAELESNVIKDPKALENLKKELASVEKQIRQEEAEKAVKDGEVVGKGATEKDVDKRVKEEQKERENKDEKDLNETEQSKADAEKLKQAYHDAMIALHEKRIQTIKKQISSGELVSANLDYEQELKLETAMYEARDAYLKLGKEDPYREKRTELIRLEKEAREPIELQLRNRSKRFREIEEEIKEIDKREREINEELLSENINEVQVEALNHELEEQAVQRKKLEVELATIKDKLDHAIGTRTQRTIKRSGLERRYIETLSDMDKKNYDYQKSKIVTMNRDFDQATKLHYQNVKRRIEEREQKIKDINKELKEVPDTDFERRLVLLNELDKETSMLEADREAKSDLDRGIIPDKQDMVQDAKEKAEKEEYRQMEFNKATEEVRDAIDRQDEKIGEAVVANPTIANMEEKDRETTLKAATVAAVVDSPAPGRDTILQDAQQFAVAKCVIPELENQVKNIDESEEGRKNAEEYLEQDKQIKEADQELDKIQSNITK